MWAEHAACAGKPLAMFFLPDDLKPNRRRRERIVRTAKTLCASCPVGADCYAEIAAVEGHTDLKSRHGIYAGLTEHERHQVIRRKDPTMRVTIRRQADGTWLMTDGQATVTTITAAAAWDLLRWIERAERSRPVEQVERRPLRLVA